jgi:AcrR family transcriptional regulator
MPRIWAETIEAHRDAVREATLDAVGALVAEHGLTGVAMSQIARESGIGRATLYKYFPDLESVLIAWHERQIARHLAQLTEIAGRPVDPGQRLASVLAAYADLQGGHGHGGDVTALLHRGDHVGRAHVHLHEFISRLIRDAARAGHVRGDIAPGELATYCLSALTAASSLPARAPRARLVSLVLAGLSTPR